MGQEMAKEQDIITLKELILKSFDFLNYLKRRLIWIIPITLTGIVFGFFYAKSQDVRYDAAIKFFAQGANTATVNPLASLGLAAVAPASGGSGKDIFEASDITYIMTSAPILERTLLSKIKFDNEEDYIINLFVKYRQAERNLLGKQTAYVGQVPYDGNRDSSNLAQNVFLRVVIKDISSDLKVEKGTSGLINGKFASTHPVFPKYFLEKLIEETSKYYVYTKTAGAVRNIKSLQSQADSIKRVMTGTISSTAYSADADPNSVRPNIVKVTYQKNQLDNTILQSTYQTLASSLVSARIELGKQIPFIQIYERPVLPLEQSSGTSAKVTMLKFGFIAFILSIIFFSSIYYYKKITVYLKN
jgi:hypothetical protein